MLKQKNFNYWKISVALNRVTIYEGLYILGLFSINAVRGNPQALEEENIMQSESELLVQNREDSPCNIEIRSLNKHAIDVVHDTRLTENGIIYFKETAWFKCRSPERTTLQTHHVGSTLKRRGNDRFHVVSTWNPRGVFVGYKHLKWFITAIKINFKA